MSEIYPVTQSYVKKSGVLYPITQSYIKKSAEVESDFSITVNSGADSSFILPTSGRLNGIGNAYAWVVDWGDGTIGTHSGVGTYSSGISHMYPQADTEYKITIKPQDPDERGWLRAFGFYSGVSGSDVPENKAKVILAEGQLTEQMVCISPNDGHICYNMFYRCPNLSMGDTFQLPQNLTSVGNGFCRDMFYYCTNLRMNSIFQLPQGLTSAGEDFCHNMFLFCTSMEMNDVFQLPQGLTSAEYGFCRSMFFFCTSLKMNDVFQLPQGLTSAGMNFCYGMFDSCTSLTAGVRRFFGGLALTQEQLNQADAYYQTFAYCSSLSEALSDIPQMQITPSSRHYTFRGAPDELIAPLHNNWK